MAVAPSPEYLQALLETFKCFICMEKVQDAHLCPHCSKLCCYSCMHRWLTEQRSQCPHCRATLHLHEIVNCRWVEDLSEQIDCLNSTVDVGSINQNQEQRCETHNEQLTVYCTTCNSTICHRCALFDNLTHYGHTFRPIEEIYNEILKQLEECCDGIRKKEELYKEVIKEIDKNIKEVQQAKEKKVRETRTVVECMMIDLEKNLNNKLTVLVSHKNHMVGESEQIEEFLHGCQMEISRMTMSQLINNTNNLKRSIAAMEQNTPILVSVLPDFHSEIIPKFEGGSLVIKSFSEKMIQSEPIYSLPIGCNGVNWRLKVYPNGNGIVKDRYLSVFLEFTSGPPGPSKYEYRIEMINQQLTNNASKNVLREFTSDFEVGECWGYNRFCRLDLLNTEGFLAQNTLTLKFKVRPPTYYQKCREQQWYISKLELEKSVISQKFEQLKQKNPIKVKPISKDTSSPKKKLKIKIQSLLDEFECTEALGSPIKDHEVHETSFSETASNLIHPPLSIQTLYDNELQNRFQGESAQSMFERLSRLFEESNNSDRPKNADNINDISLNNIKSSNESDYNVENCFTQYEADHTDHSEPKKLGCAQINKIQNELTEARLRLNKLENTMRNSQFESSNDEAGASIPMSLPISENRIDSPHQTTLDHGSHNPIHYKNEKTVDQEISINQNLPNRFLSLTEIADDIDGIINSVYVDSDDWVSSQSSSSDDEPSPNNESLDPPDHLTKD